VSHEARALLADQIGKFKLERVNENGRISFKTNGNIDFFGEEVLTRVGGAGGESNRRARLKSRNLLILRTARNAKTARKVFRGYAAVTRSAARNFHRERIHGYAKFHFVYEEQLTTPGGAPSCRIIPAISHLRKGCPTDKPKFHFSHVFRHSSAYPTR
jgi:hypothetical protein